MSFRKHVEALHDGKDYVDSLTALRDNDPAVIVKGSARVNRTAIRIGSVERRTRAAAMFKQRNAPGDDRRAILAEGDSVSGDRPDNLQDHLHAPRYAAKCAAVRKFSWV